MSEEPYITEEEIVIHRKYNPKYGDDRICKCGHPYYRHFDSYEEMYNCGCKYCGCHTFEELPEGELRTDPCDFCRLESKDKCLEDDICHDKVEHNREKEANNS